MSSSSPDGDSPNKEESPLPSDELGVIWDDDKIKKFSLNGKQTWQCLWCGKQFQHWNATKALHHLVRIPGSAIKICDSKAIDSKHQRLYNALYKKSMLKKNMNKTVRETKKRHSITHVEDAGSVLLATRPTKQRKLDNLPSSSEVPTSAENARTLVFHQQKIFDQPDQQSESQLTMAIADLIHSCGLPFSLASHHKFHLVLKLAKNASSKYMPPTRNRVSGDLLDLNYDLYQKKMQESPLKEADVYGLAYFGDGATIKRVPLINIMASSVHNSAACLSIVDCTTHLESGGTKDATYIADIFLPHIQAMEDKVKDTTDLVIFDGASNVQKAGRILEAHFPRASVIHGAEHVISLFYSDIFKLEEFDNIRKLNQILYRVFGSGSMHSPYATFLKHSRDHNAGRSLGLIRASDTRMGGHVISMMRTLRLKDALVSTVSSASFIQARHKIDKRIFGICRDKKVWEVIKVFIRAVFPMLIVLRLADKKEPVMDKLHFYVRRMDQTIRKSTDDLDSYSGKFATLILSRIHTIDEEVADETNIPDNVDGEDDYISMGDGSETAPHSLGDKVQHIWKRRRQALTSDFSIAGWMLSPVPEVHLQVKTC